MVSNDGRGFIVNSNEVISKRRTGKQIMNLKSSNKAISCLSINGDMLAIVGENRKLLIFDVNEIPILSKGQGVILQRYKDGKCSDIKIISSNEDQKKQYQSGNSKVLGWFVGQVMKETKGQANPSVVNKVIIDKLKK